MTDIHCHILYGVDDGSDCLSESVEMARIAYESGTRMIIATPHANIPGTDGNPWNAEAEALLVNLNLKLKSEGIGLTVCPGQEVFAFGNLEKKISDKEVISLNGSRYLLLEFDFEEQGDYLLDRCGELIQLGLTPVVAHPERYRALQEDMDVAYDLKEMGCLFQLNKGSLFGSFGEDARETAHRFLGETLADFIASDAHSPYVRTPYMADAHELISGEYSPDYADFLFSENPALLIADKEINPF